MLIASCILKKKKLYLHPELELKLSNSQSILTKVDLKTKIAGVVKLVDTPDLGSGSERCAGSSPSIRTIRSRF